MAWHEAPMGAPRAIVIDCDPGVDDAVALLVALASPEALEVRAVTAVAGNVALARTADNARRLCAFAGRADVPVFAGCARPILGEAGDAAHVHGDDGLAGLSLPEPDTPLAPGHAVDALIACLTGAEAPLTLVALGPLTNLALAIVKAPEIVPRIGEIALMGGAVAGGNVTPTAEFNIHCDPCAAAVVLGSGAPIAMIGLDVTRQAVASANRIAAIEALANPVARAVAAMLRGHRGEDGAGPALVHDACVIAYLLAPGLFTFRPMAVSVRLEGPERARTLAEPDPASPLRIAETVEADDLFALLTERLGRY